MTRHWYALALALTISAAPAAGNPPIAYAKGSTSQLYLTNDDGSGTVLLYKSPRRKKIFSMAMSPGTPSAPENQIAIVEGDCCFSPGDGWTLKVISYDGSGHRVHHSKDFTGCRPDSLAYPSTGRTLAFVNCNGKVWTGDTDADELALQEVDTGAGRIVSKVSWTGANTLLAAGYDNGQPGLFTFALGNAAEWAYVAYADSVSAVDAADDGSRALIGVAGSTGSIKLVSPLTPATPGTASVTDVTTGASPAFSTDGTRLVYIARDSRGQVVKVRAVATAVGEQIIAKRGEFSAVAWASGGTATTSSQTDFGIRPVE